MKTKRDYSLVKDGKYNMVAIMQQAWRYAKYHGWSLKFALSETWYKANEAMQEHKWELANIEAQKRLQEKQSETSTEQISTADNSADYGYNRGYHYGVLTGWGYNYSGD